MHTRNKRKLTQLDYYHTTETQWSKQRKDAMPKTERGASLQ